MPTTPMVTHVCHERHEVTTNLCRDSPKEDLLQNNEWISYEKHKDKRRCLSRAQFNNLIIFISFFWNSQHVEKRNSTNTIQENDMLTQKHVLSGNVQIQWERVQHTLDIHIVQFHICVQDAYILFMIGYCAATGIGIILCFFNMWMYTYLACTAFLCERISLLATVWMRTDARAYGNFSISNVCNHMLNTCEKSNTNQLILAYNIAVVCIKTNPFFFFSKKDVFKTMWKNNFTHQKKSQHFVDFSERNNIFF